MADSAVITEQNLAFGETLRTRANGPSYLLRSYPAVLALLATDFPTFTLQLAVVRASPHSGWTKNASLSAKQLQRDTETRKFASAN